VRRSFNGSALRKEFDVTCIQCNRETDAWVINKKGVLCPACRGRKSEVKKKVIQDWQRQCRGCGRLVSKNKARCIYCGHEEDDS